MKLVGSDGMLANVPRQGNDMKLLNSHYWLGLARCVILVNIPTIAERGVS